MVAFNTRRGVAVQFRNSLIKTHFIIQMSNNDKTISVRGGGGRGGNCPPKFGEDKIRANSSGRIGKNKFLSVIKTEKFSKIGNDEQEFGY